MNTLFYFFSFRCHFRGLEIPFKGGNASSRFYHVITSQEHISFPKTHLKPFAGIEIAPASKNIYTQQLS